MMTVSIAPPRFLTVSRDTTPRYYTIMAFQNADCSDNGARVNYFSNPAVDVNNLPTGETGENGDGERNNAQTIINNKVRFFE